MKPTIKAFESRGQYKFDVRMVREGMPAFKIQFARTDADVWHDVAFSTSRQVHRHDLTNHPGPTRTHPIVRAILLKDNEHVGLPSDIVPATVNP